MEKRITNATAFLSAVTAFSPRSQLPRQFVPIDTVRRSFAGPLSQAVDARLQNPPDDRLLRRIHKAPPSLIRTQQFQKRSLESSWFGAQPERR